MRYLCVLFAFFVCALADSVPVFIWTTGNGDSLEYLGTSKATNDILSSFIDNTLTSNKHRVVLFLQEELSVNDITQNAQVYEAQSNGGSFKYIKKLMRDQPSVFLQQSVGSLGNVEEIRKMFSGRITETSYDEILKSNMSLNQRSAELIVIHLPKPHPDETTFRDIDEFVGLSTSSLVGSNNPFIGIYTGLKTTPVDVDEDNSPKVGRRLLSTTGVDYTFFNLSNCLYFYAENISFSLGGDTWNLPPGFATMDPISYCANDSAELNISYTGFDPNLQSLSLLFNFGVTTGFNAGYWLLTNFSVTYQYLNGSDFEGATVDLLPYFVTETPMAFSYSCFQIPNIPPVNTSSSTQKIGIGFVGLQVQAFVIYNNQFGYYNDCVGFFTITTWACLIVVFLLFIILAWGMVMLNSITTPDRYDDPKGKTISVSSVE